MRRKPSGRLFPDSLTISRRTWSNTKGESVATPTTETRPGSLQPMPPDRVHEHGTEGARGDYLALFPAPDPDVTEGDTITDGDVIVTVLGPAQNDVGREACYAVFCTRKV